MSNQPISEIELTQDHLDFLFDAGASPAFLEVVGQTGDDLPSTVERNSARDEVKKYVKWGDLDGSPDDLVPMGGHFFEALWSGDLYDAFTRADLNNRKILLLTFGERRINAYRPNRSYPTVARLQGRA
ncbi:hypothetical protein JMJ58_19440 [Haloterrigena salifodinae]|uniref:Uncharacterized protein n=1 Tax=Haloterrigena salifodinae TaxID=2675099 RepID=A0A8T8DZU9_9EURY|nr:hypothetical protein [Haloterrigena salifodinae]QRV15055.1 hypothetical protein JMJ58_19440 [Haloterrigena salifodinae]